MIGRDPHRGGRRCPDNAPRRCGHNGAGRRSALAFAAAALALLMLAPCAARAATPGFGIDSYALRSTSTQAGAHADLTTEFKLDTTASGEPLGQLKDAHVALPPGVVGNTHALPQCTQNDFEAFRCQPAAQIGMLSLSFFIGEPVGPVSIPVYNLTPTPGHLATFASSIIFATVIIQVDLSRDGSYRVVATMSDVSTLIPIVGAGLSLWGVPAAPAHDAERWSSESAPELVYGEPNEFGEREVIGIAPTPAGVSPRPFLTNATDCAAGPPTSTLSVDSWQQPDEPVTRSSALGTPTGCERLQIAPTLSVTPDSTRRDTPSGYDIDLRYPLDDEYFELGTPSLRELTLTLPAGTSLSPGVANGLLACSDADFAADACPSAAKIGAVALSTPYLPDRLSGAIYLGVSHAAATYPILVSAAADGVSVRLSGLARADTSTGQLTVSFDEAPPLPFDDLDLRLYGGPGAALANPASCGPARTSAQLSAYGGTGASAASSFSVDANGAGGPCPARAFFAPRVSAGTLSQLAGGSSPFTLSVARDDGQQPLATISARLPAGLEGTLGDVPECGEGQLAQGACPAASLLGSVTIGAGAGSQPLYLTGSVYLTGPYRGAPFGLAIVTPVHAGPFDLGTIVVRSQVDVDPDSLRLSVVSDPLPQILAGIPLRLRLVNLTLDRPGFIRAPTDCSPQAIFTDVGSAEGAAAGVTEPFQVVGCAGLPFAPRLSAATGARASRRGDGAALDVKLTNPAGPRANIRSFSVALPRRLRPRLQTIQQACRAATFHADPAACPPASLVGRVQIDTPLLAAPLHGPVRLVFRGGSAYPDLVMSVAGDGIAATLDGVLSVSTRGQIGAAFKSLPDLPLSSLELVLPAGPRSLLGAIAGLCTQPLKLPYAIAAQSRARITATATVAVSGCPARRPHKPHRKGR